MISHPKLATKLDVISPEDSETLRHWRNDPTIFKWCRQNDLLTESKHSAWMSQHPMSERIKMYLIVNESDIPVGVCGLTDFDLINQRAEFSLYIGPEHQGKGYGEDALKLLCYHGFNAYPLNVIWGESFEGNPALSIFERIGFKNEGVRRDFYFRNGKHINAVLFSIKRDEFDL